MAIISLKNVKVTRVNQSGNGFQVAEEYTSRGEARTTRYTIWAESAHGYAVGDIVPTVSGFLSAKVGERKDKEENVRHSVELSINSPRFGNEAPTAEPDVWGTSVPDETPF